MKRAFTLIEVLVVIAIIAIVAAILFPVFSRAKNAAKQTNCISNLSQIGKATALYMIDYDDIFPYALDASDKYASDIWNGNPQFRALIDSMPMMQDALHPYTKNKEIFRCPSDSGTQVLDNHFPIELKSSPSLYQTTGNSYFYRTEIAFRQYSQTALEYPAQINLMFDAAGHWHTTSRALYLGDNPTEYFNKIKNFRYTTLFADFHAKSLHRDQIQQAWDLDL